MAGPSLHRSFSFEGDDDHSLPQTTTTSAPIDSAAVAATKTGDQTTNSTAAPANVTSSTARVSPPLSTASSYTAHSTRNPSVNTPRHSYHSAIQPPLRSINDESETDTTEDDRPPPVPLHGTPRNQGAMAVGGGVPAAGLYRDQASRSTNRQSGSEASSLMEAESQASRNRGSTSTFEDHPRYGPNTPYSARNTSEYSSTAALGAAAAMPGQMTPYSGSQLSIPLGDYPNTGYGGAGSYYSGFSSRHSTVLEQSNQFDPHDIVDDGDDGFFPDPRRKSMLTRGASNAGLGGGAAGGLMRKLTTVGRKPIPESEAEYGPVGSNGAPSPLPRMSPEKEAEYMAQQMKKEQRNRRLMIIGLGVFVMVAIIASILGGVLGSAGGDDDSKSASTTSSSSSSSTTNDEVLTKNSQTIKNLMGNENLHKVFPAMDYTPYAAQYPDCINWESPSQDNVTQDMAVLSQLTNAVRLYGTDCNQTQKVLEAITRLELTDMKVWLGVWLDTNATTSKRQLTQMYDILENYTDHSIFKGVIVGNEVLYRAGDSDLATAETDLITTLTDVRNNFTDRGWSLNISTSDLGDNWNAQLADAVDSVMSNVHPFFAGVEIDNAASWAWTFWDTHDVVLTEGTGTANIISEIGWPSGGGNDCGEGTCTSDTDGSVAGIDEMNTFLGEWVCQALANGTEYFWYVPLLSE